MLRLVIGTLGIFPLLSGRSGAFPCRRCYSGRSGRSGAFPFPLLSVVIRTLGTLRGISISVVIRTLRALRGISIPVVIGTLGALGGISHHRYYPDGFGNGVCDGAGGG